MRDRLIDAWLEKVPYSWPLLHGCYGWLRAFAEVFYALTVPEEVEFR